MQRRTNVRMRQVQKGVKLVKSPKHRMLRNHAFRDLKRQRAKFGGPEKQLIGNAVRDMKKMKNLAGGSRRTKKLLRRLANGVDQLIRTERKVGHAAAARKLPPRQRHALRRALHAARRKSRRRFVASKLRWTTSTVGWGNHFGRAGRTGCRRDSTLVGLLHKRCSGIQTSDVLGGRCAKLQTAKGRGMAPSCRRVSAPRNKRQRRGWWRCPAKHFLQGWQWNGHRARSYQCCRLDRGPVVTGCIMVDAEVKAGRDRCSIWSECPRGYMLRGVQTNGKRVVKLQCCAVKAPLARRGMLFHAPPLR